MKSGMKQTEIGEVPADWEVVDLDSLIQKDRGITYGIVQPGKFDEEGVFLVRGKDYTRGWASPNELFRVSSKIEAPFKRARLAKNDILLSIAGSVGFVALVPEWLEGANITQTTARIAIDKECADYRFCYQFLQSDIGWQNIKNYIKGGAQQGLNLADVKKFIVLLPPLPEQRKIAEILSTLDEKMAVIDEQLAQTQEMKKGLMQRLLTRGIGHTEFKDSPLGEIPTSWDVIHFEECLGDKNPLSYGILQPGEGVDDGIPMLRTVDLSENGLADTKILKVPKVISAQYEKTVLRGGEILFSVMGTLGRTAVVHDSWVGWNVNRALAVIRLNARVDRIFFSYILKSPVFQAHIVKQSIGSAQMRINLGDLRTYWIQVPTLPEQHQIAEILTIIDDKIGVLQDKKAQYYALKKGLMQQLLTGQRRVNID